MLLTTGVHSRVAIMVKTKISTILVLMVTVTFAGITGKIGGTITDDKNGEPLPGVNIYLSETQLGSVTDANGHFVILNIPPGEYTLNIQMIGYTNVIVQDVPVYIDQTTTINRQLQLETLGLAEVTVTAERSYVETDVSSSKINISDDVIEKIPVNHINQVIGLQAGVNGLSIRGSSSTQTGVYVDGFLQNTSRSFSPVTTTSLLGVSEIQVISSGFNAEYGNIRSGIINIVNKEGRPDRFHGSMAVQYRPAGPKHFGPSVFDPDSYFLRPYLDTAVCWTGTENGVWDDYTEAQYPQFEGWNVVSETTLGDADPDNDLSPEQAQRLFIWEHRRKGDITEPDRTYDIAIGGPIPGPEALNPRFYLTHYSEKSMYIFPLSKDRYNSWTTRLKLNMDISENADLMILGNYGETHSVSPYNWTTTPTGYVLQSDQSVANLLNSSSGNSIIYMPGYYSPTTIFMSGYGMKYTHMLSSTRYFEILTQVSKTYYKTYQTALRDTAKSHELFNGYFVDEAPFGYWGYGVTGIDGMNIGGWMNIGRDKSRDSRFIIKADYADQLNNRNQVKTGFEYVQNNLDVYSFASNPGMSTWNRALVYNVQPFRLSLYAQDKMEYEGFVANIGLRGEVSNSNTVVYTLDPYDKNLSQGLGHDIEDSVQTEESELQFSLHPRLGVSFPVTDVSKLFFNYGHFYSEPGTQYRFGIQRESNGIVTNLGNPNLRYEKTISYELGYSQVFYDDYLINLVAYYKDVSGQIGWITYQNLNNSVKYNQAANNNYEDIRGFEFTLEKVHGDFLSGFVNFTYISKTSGYFGFTNYYEDPNLQRESDIVNRKLIRHDYQPHVNAVMNFTTPNSFGPRIFGIRPAENWVFSNIFYYETGRYDTYNPYQRPGIVDDVQWKDEWYLDFRLARTFEIQKSRFRVYVDISNVTNNKYLNSAGFSDNYDYLAYMESLRFDWEEGSQKGSDRVGKYREDDIPYRAFDPVDPDNLTDEEQEILDTNAYIDMPNLRSVTFLNPRNIVFGFTVEF